MKMGARSADSVLRELAWWFRLAVVMSGAYLVGDWDPK
jgi:hypothetical protein